MTENSIHNESLALADEFVALYNDPNADTGATLKALDAYRAKRRMIAKPANGAPRFGAREAYKHTQGIV